MRRSLGFFLLANFCFVSQLFGQDLGSKTRNRYFLVPMDAVLVASVAEPECPLVIENVRLLRDVEGRTPGFYAYQLRNIGTKSIAAYTLSVWYSDATGATLKPETIEGNLLPNDTMLAPSLKRGLELVPLSKELRQRLGLHKVQQVLAVIMVEHIHFTDGTSYHSEKLSSAIEQYFLKMNGFVGGEVIRGRRR